MNPGMVFAAEGIPLPPIAFPMLMTLTIKTLIVFASTSLVVGAFPSFAGANPAGFISEPDVGASRVFKPLPSGVRYSRLKPSSNAGYISEPDVGTSRVWGPPKGAAKHNQKLLIRRLQTKRADRRLSFPQSEW